MLAENCLIGNCPRKLSESLTKKELLEIVQFTTFEDDNYSIEYV